MKTNGTKSAEVLRSQQISGEERSFSDSWHQYAFGGQRSEEAINAIAFHPWYLRVQVGRLRCFQVGEREDALHEAVVLFSARLKKNPTLGLAEGMDHMLAAHVCQHARSIASSLYRRRAEQTKCISLEQHPVGKEPSVAHSSVVMLIEEFHEMLRDDEWFVCLMRYRMDWALADVAAALGTTVYQVRQAQDSLRKRLEAYRSLA